MLTGTVALITGGSRGIGAACARKLAALGADIAVVYAGNTEKANEVCAACEALGVRARAYQCDVADFDATAATAAMSRMMTSRSMRLSFPNRRPFSSMIFI